MLVEEGGYKLYHSVWELPIICLAWKISSSHSCCIDNKSMPLKMLFNLYFKTELWHLYKSLLPSAKGLSIYFYVESSPFLLKAPAGEHTVVCIHYYWFILGMTWLDLFYHELQCLVSSWSLKVLCIYVLRSERASEIPFCYIMLWLFWESVVIQVLLLWLASWLCYWYE